MKFFDFITLLIVITGGINLGAMAFGNDFVDILFGSVPMVKKIVYLVIGGCAIFQIKNLAKSKD